MHSSDSTLDSRKADRAENPTRSAIPGKPLDRESLDHDRSNPSRQEPNSPGGKQKVAPTRQEQDSRSDSRPITINRTGIAPAETGASTLDDAPLMLRKNPSTLFPLLLAPIDGFYCADDSPRFPMTSIIFMDFEGKLQREAFELALEDALVRHPLLRAFIRPAKRGLPCWVSAKNTMPQIDWSDAEQPVKLHEQEGFDLSQEVGIRFWIRTSDTTTRMTVQVHHACTDGTGVYRFLGDLLALYGIRTSDSEKLPQLESLDPQLLRTRRRRMSELANDNSKRLSFIYQGLKEAARVFGRRVQPLASPSSRHGSELPQSDQEFPDVQSFMMSKDEHELLRKVAAKQGAMLNDLLMAEMFRTILRWNDQQGMKSKRWIRIMMPSDLRGTEDYAMPASNLTSYTFLARNHQDCHDAQKLIRSIREETGKIKNDRLGTRFADAITLSEYKPQVLAALLKRNWCIATTTLSNVGDPSKRFTARFPRNKGRVVCGNLVLNHVSGVPPLRNQTHATLAIFSYRRQLTISVRCNPYMFTVEDTRAFLDMYEAGLRSYLDIS